VNWGSAGLIVIAFAAFAGLHSLIAGLAPRERLKQVIDPRLVEGWYRLAYNLVAAVMLIPTLVLIALLPDRTLWVVPMPWAAPLLALQGIGLLGLVGALFATDVWRFAGLRQVRAYLSGDPLPLPAPVLQESGMYRYVRHPLYFFSLLVIWPSPIMTGNVLVFNVVATLYFIVGSRIEERRLLRVHGDAYRAYRRRVSWLVPLPPRRAKAIDRQPGSVGPTSAD
jgi:protein-S-isoprenylcysteine O-methyltransferase Ste14